jgi:HEAT repeat protein
MRLDRVVAALLFAAGLAGCVSFGPEPGPPKGTYRERLIGFARLLRMEDRRAYDPLLSGRTASSPDPWLRAKTALAISRLKDPDASLYLPVLLRDGEATVRRAAAFGAGLSGDARLVRFLAAALGDEDPETGANAAEALGKLGGKDATDALLAALAKPARPRAASALALFRNPEPRTVAALLAVFSEDSSRAARGAWKGKGDGWALERRDRLGGAGPWTSRGRRERLRPRPPRGAPRGFGFRTGPDRAPFTF